MTTVSDAVERNGNRFEDVRPAGKFGWTAACTRGERIAARIHLSQL